ncbi:GNAT family N-acetyltransferase [Rhodococcus sp. USK13]|uniref:GNAT family N-acetyltransferase n=1 Tax=Rhodococcus sp. USK13 TaxID=2806442 RepID=UPI001BCA76E4|nr:GNAT family N-acetyltransferase [Rhodococcus sp. USK13]
MTSAQKRAIVVGVDGSETGDNAALWAARFADRLQCPLCIVHAFGDESSSMAGAAVPGEHPATTRTHHRSAHEVLDRTVAAVRRGVPGVRLRADLVPGLAGRVLTTRSADAHLIVVGTVGTDAWHCSPIGTTALEVATNASCPVAVWRGISLSAAPDRRPVVVGVDGSDTSERVVRAAGEYAALLRAPLIAVQACPHPGATSTGRTPLGKVCAAAKRRVPGLDITPLTTYGDPYGALRERAAHAQLLVLGDHHRSWDAEPVLGPVSGALLRYSPCPTLVWRGLGDQRRSAKNNTGSASSTALRVADTAKPGVTVRYLTADDRQAVRDLHERMSVHDAHLRFFGARPKHLDELAEAVCRRDYTHLALGAFDGDELVGVANYIVTDTSSGHIRAEIALAVSGHEQRHGIGTELLRRLGVAAYQHGVTHLTAEILAENDLMLAVIAEQGWSHTLHREGAVVHFDLELVSRSAPPDAEASLEHRQSARAVDKRGR